MIRYAHMNHKSIKNKKEYLERYALNREDGEGCRGLISTMNKLTKSKVQNIIKEN